MKLLPFVLLAPLLLWQCATPAGPKAPPKAQVTGIDDDHRDVGAAEFLESPWKALPAGVKWTPVAQGVTVSLADGRDVSLSFVQPGVVRFWIPAGAGEVPASPAGRYAGLAAPEVRASESAGVLTVTSGSLSVRLQLKDLSWVLSRGDKVVLRTSGGPRAAGRRLNLGFLSNDQARWVGPGLGPRAAVRHWGGAEPTVPAVFGAGGTVPVALALDTGYQSYTRSDATEVSLGTLNGGLDLILSAAPQASSVLEGLTAVLGRPEVPPSWAAGTALVLPPTETGAFIRKAKLAVESAAGPFRADRPRFQAMIPAPSGPLLPDLTLAATRGTWAVRDTLVTVPAGAGLSLGTVSGRTDWNTRFDDQGRNTLLAGAGPLLPGLEARAMNEAQRLRAPLLRSWVTGASTGPGMVREAAVEVTVGVETDENALARVLALGLAGQGTPAVRLDLSGLADPEAQTKTLARLAFWLWAPVLTLDWGTDPGALWAALGDGPRRTLKTLLDRRSQFKPLMNQLLRDTAQTGRPAWTPLWFATPATPATLAADNEFLLGSSLLAAPTTQPGSRTVYLPGPGVWFDFWTGEEFGGGRSYEVEGRPDRPILFAAGGAFVPMREPEVFDEKDVYNPLTIHVFPGGTGSGTYWVDDGVTTAWKTGAVVQTQLTYDYSQKEMTLDHKEVSASNRVKADPYLLYRLHNVYKPRQVKIAGKAIPLFGDSWGITDTDRSAAWYESDHTLLIKTFRPDREQTIAMSF